MVLPYFTSSGTPYFDAVTPGAILGLRFGTTREEILLALLEGVAMEMRLNLQILKESGVPVSVLRAVGGGAGNRAWLQLKADVTGRPIQPVSVPEAGCLGTALLGCAAHTGQSINSLASRWVQSPGLIEPDEHRARFYTERFASYRKLQPTLRSLSI